MTHLLTPNTQLPAMAVYASQTMQSSSSSCDTWASTCSRDRVLLSRDRYLSVYDLTAATEPADASDHSSIITTTTTTTTTPDTDTLTSSLYRCGHSSGVDAMSACGRWLLTTSKLDPTSPHPPHHPLSYVSPHPYYTPYRTSYHTFVTFYTSHYPL